MASQSRRIIESGLGKMPERTVDRSYPDLAKSLRDCIPSILENWRKQTVLEHPELNRLSIDEFYNEIERILNVMAGALASNDRSRWLGLAETSTTHGYDRFNLDYSLADLMTEERTLRRVIVDEIEQVLQRELNSDEASALHTAIDFMLQQGVLAMVQVQKDTLRAANESQVKYLSFLSHDLANNLMVLRLRLETVKSRLEKADGFDDCVDMVAAALDTIQHTTQGTRRMVEYQSLRKGKVRPSPTAVKLRESVLVLVDVIQTYAQLRNVNFDVQIDPEATASTDPNLLALILQNLINNAVKHAKPEGGSVTIDAKPHARNGETEQWTITVADDGPGIPEEIRKAITESCNLSEGLGAPGLGLGMAIACQAAQLLKSKIEINPNHGGGTIISFRLPATAHEAAMQ